MRAGLSFSRSPISLLLRQPLSIKKSYAGAIQVRRKNIQYKPTHMAFVGSSTKTDTDRRMSKGGRHCGCIKADAE
jgi:hypothetical protein